MLEAPEGEEDTALGGGYVGFELFFVEGKPACSQLGLLYSVPAVNFLESDAD